MYMYIESLLKVRHHMIQLHHSYTVMVSICVYTLITVRAAAFSGWPWLLYTMYIYIYIYIYIIKSLGRLLRMSSRVPGFSTCTTYLS